MDGKKRVCIVGGGPSALFMFKRFVDINNEKFEVHIFERNSQLGAGMPYSSEGALQEHITNVSANEIPTIVTPMAQWAATVPSLLARYNITPESFNDYKVLPRLLFGKYLEDQFSMLKEMASEQGMDTKVHLQSEVLDIRDLQSEEKFEIELSDGVRHRFDIIIICTGHNWPKTHEGKIGGYFDSPYPPSKLRLQLDHEVAIRGSSLTAIDAIRTLARHNGEFTERGDGLLQYTAHPGSENFKMTMHSRNGLLPAVRFHLEDSHLKNDALLTAEEIAQHRSENNGFLSLDYIFEKDFKEQFISKDPEFYDRIKDMTLEDFVDEMMELRERLDPFTLLKAEYAEAEKSIRRHESIYWKEMLAVLSFAMNYPAKYFSAEDMLRLKGTLSPLISVVIAFVPQTSCRELLALHDAGKLGAVSVGADGRIEICESSGIVYHFTDDGEQSVSVPYATFVDCIGQPQIQFEDFPFRGLIEGKVVSKAYLKFKSTEEGLKELEKGNQPVIASQAGDYFMQVPGIAINDNFQAVDLYGAYHERLYIMAVPYIGGYNPDYSGLDFSEAASEKIINSLLAQVGPCN